MTSPSNRECSIFSADLVPLILGVFIVWFICDSIKPAPGLAAKVWQVVGAPRVEHTEIAAGHTMF
jgi:hypothetical protein